MTFLRIALYEWKHFIRKPYKIAALGLFLLAGLYGLNNGAKLYNKQSALIESIEAKIDTERQTVLNDAFQSGTYHLEDRPWIDYRMPYWALYNSWTYSFKKPSPAMVYAIGQSEQFGYYKRITMWASPYDADLAEEISNPERLQHGSIDFAFALLFLLPLTLIVLLYDVKGAEQEQGIMPLITIQSNQARGWLIARLSFYLLLLILSLSALIGVGALLTPVLAQHSSAMLQTWAYAMLYLALWMLIAFFIINWSKSPLSNALYLSATYLCLSIVNPALVHQVLSIYYPSNLMVEMIDADRDKKEQLFNLSGDEHRAQLLQLYPDVANSPVYNDSIAINMATRRSLSALVNQLKRSSAQGLQNDNQSKNAFISRLNWFNPLAYFQNQFNRIAETHFDNYAAYRQQIQTTIDQLIDYLIEDTWNKVEVDEERFNMYHQNLTK